MAGDDPTDRGDSADHTIQIWQVNKDRLEWMKQKIADSPRILSRSAGRSSCCIFKVPDSLVEINGRSSYQPHIVSIGPFHHGDPRLRMIEEHKWRFLGSLLKRTPQVKLEDLLAAVQPLEARARDCYSTSVALTADEFIEMLVLDGCFVIELLRKFGGVVAFEADDPLMSLSWVLSFLLRDLIRLENQIPFFVLEPLFDLTRLPGEEDEKSPNLRTLTLAFFNNALQRSDDFVNRLRSLPGLHLLDLLRSSFLPAGYEEPKPGTGPISSTNVIQPISNLHRAGIRLRPRRDESESFLAVRFHRGVIEMPTITIDDFTSVFLVNCVAYEQCRRACSKHMTTYATLLDCLVNTTHDVEYLCEQRIVENYLGTDAELVRLINNMGKDVSFDIDLCYLSRVFDEVNGYYRNHWHVHWASFKYTYFRTPWSFISALAALVLLLLTVTQTTYSVMAYVRPP